MGPKWDRARLLAGGEDGMWAWLHEHAVEVQAGAALVQAFAAIATVALTAVLVWATRRYVGLTAELAKAAIAGAEWQQRGAATQRRFFCGLLGRLELLVADLPEDRDESKIRAARGWKDEDVEQFLAFAASMGDETMVEAESAGPSLRVAFRRSQSPFASRSKKILALNTQDVVRLQNLLA
jgi:hypothetical protein